MGESFCHARAFGCACIPLRSVPIAFASQSRYRCFCISILISSSLLLEGDGDRSIKRISFPFLSFPFLAATPIESPQCEEAKRQAGQRNRGRGREGAAQQEGRGGDALTTTLHAGIVAKFDAAQKHLAELLNRSFFCVTLHAAHIATRHACIHI